MNEEFFLLFLLNIIINLEMDPYNNHLLLLKTKLLN